MVRRRKPSNRRKEIKKKKKFKEFIGILTRACNSIMEVKNDK